MHILYVVCGWVVFVMSAILEGDFNMVWWLVLMGVCVVLSTVLAYQLEIRRQLRLHCKARKNYCFVTDPAQSTIVPMFYLSIVLTGIIWALAGQVSLLIAAGVLLLSIFQYPLALNVVACFQRLVRHLLLSVD
jgi:hypothetical protein